MANLCAACSHEKRREIDAAIVAGVPNRRIAAQYGMGESSVRRHREHLPKAVVKRHEKQEEKRAQTLAEQVAEQVQKCQWLARVARDTLRDAKGDPDAAPRAITACGVPMRELRGYLELLGKLTGELATGPSAVAIAGAQASATAGVEAQLAALTDEELAEELRAALDAVEARIAGKEKTA